MARILGIDHDTPDPTAAIGAFYHAMHKARQLGLAPRTEHQLAEQLFRGEAKILFYSGGMGAGCVSLVLDDDILEWEDQFEVIKFVMERHGSRKKEQRALAKSIEAFAKAALEEAAPVEEAA